MRPRRPVGGERIGPVSAAWSSSLALALAFALACRPAAESAAPTPASPPIAEAPPPAPADPELAAIADAIDPGEVKPLLTITPPWLAGLLQRQLPEGTSPEAIQELARDDLATYEREASEDPIAAFVALGRAAYLGERLLLEGRDDPELLALLEKTYTILQNPFFAAPNGFFRQSFEKVIAAASRAGVVDDQAKIQELVTFLQDAFTRARPLRQRSAALLLRRHPNHPAIPEVILHQAEAADQREDHGEALRLTRLAIARTEPPNPRYLANLAHRCATALDLSCAAEARAQLHASPPAADAKARREHDERLTRIDAAIAQATEAQALADQAGIDAGLRRGHLLILLGRYSDAEALYEALKAAHPRDARPHAGLAKIVFQRDLDFYGAVPVVEAGRRLDHRDHDFFQVSLGLASVRLMADVIPRAAEKGSIADLLGPFLRDFREDARGYAQGEPGRGAVLLTLADDLEKILPAAIAGEPSKATPVIRRLLADFDRVRRAHPEVADAWHATLAATQFSDDHRRSWTIAAGPLPAALEGDDALQIARHRTLRSLVLLWEDDRAVADLEAALALLPGRLRDHDDAVETRALQDALRARAGDAAARARASAAYRGLAQRSKGVVRARFLTNAAVLLAEGGELAAAIELLNAAIPLVDDRTRPFIFLAGAALSPSPEFADELEVIADKATTSSARLHARAWRAELARRQGDPAVDDLERRYRAELARERQSELRGHMPRGRLGVALTGDFNINLNYTVREGLTLVFTVNSFHWLLPPAPLTLAEDGKAAKKR